MTRRPAHSEEYKIAGWQIVFEYRFCRVVVRLHSGKRVRTRWFPSRSDAMTRALQVLQKRGALRARQRLPGPLQALMAVSVSSRARDGRQEAREIRR